MKGNFNVTWCPFCNQGWVQIVKDSGNDRTLLLCEECDTTWEKPGDIMLDKPTHYLFTGKAIFPDITEVKNMGWDKNIVDGW